MRFLRRLTESGDDSRVDEAKRTATCRPATSTRTGKTLREWALACVDAVRVRLHGEVWFSLAAAGRTPEQSGLRKASSPCMAKFAAPFPLLSAETLAVVANGDVIMSGAAF